MAARPDFERAYVIEVMRDYPTYVEVQLIDANLNIQKLTRILDQLVTEGIIQRQPRSVPCLDCGSERSVVYEYRDAS